VKLRSTLIAPRKAHAPTPEPLPVESPGPWSDSSYSRLTSAALLSSRKATKRESLSLRDYRRTRPSASAAIAAGASSRRGNAVSSRDRGCTQKEVLSKLSLPSDMSIADVPSARVGAALTKPQGKAGRLYNASIVNTGLEAL
jgi:hypothetical protein